MTPWQTDGAIRILIADPDADLRARYRASLHATEELIEAADGRDALVKALAAPPAMLVTELRLPFIDGVALCDILRRDPTTAHVPIVVVTDIVEPKQIDRARHAGADAVLTKPASFLAIRQQMHRLIAHSQELQERSSVARADATTQQHRAVALLSHADTARRLQRSKARQRFSTTAPPAAPPALTCPTCDQPLKYEHSHVGGVSDIHPEQWDYYQCAVCGAFQYRQRTRKLRHVF